MKKFTPAELKLQAEVIRRVLQTGTKEELKKLGEAYLDPQLHPAIKELIESEWQQAVEKDERRALRELGSLKIPTRHAEGPDIGVIKAAMDGGLDRKEAITLAEKISKFAEDRYPSRRNKK